MEVSITVGGFPFLFFTSYYHSPTDVSMELALSTYIRVVSTLETEFWIWQKGLLRHETTVSSLPLGNT